MRITSALLLFCFVTPAFGSDLEDRIARLEKRADAVDKKLESADAKLDAILAAVTASKSKAVAEAPKTATAPPAATALRAAIGHTHTCANGHTWDHSVTTSHNCPVCGLYQNIQDSAPRAVTTAGWNAAPATYYSLPQASFGSSYSAGGCSNGSCATPQYQTQRRGLFGRIR